MTTLAQEATISFGAALAWLAGIGGALMTTFIVAAFTFAWRADKQLGVIALELKGLRLDIHDHEDRIRNIEGKPSRREERDRNKRAVLES